MPTPLSLARQSRRADGNGLSPWRWWQDRDRSTRRSYSHPTDVDNLRHFCRTTFGQRCHGLGYSKRYHRVLPRVSQRLGVPTQRQRSDAREFPFRRGLQFAQQRHRRSEVYRQRCLQHFHGEQFRAERHKQKPNQQTLGEGPVTGQEVIFSFSISPDLLPADHYFFVPLVQLSDGEFMWLSAPKPIVSGTPFTPDLQAWIRNEELAPDWLRVGTEIVGGSPAPTFNASFSLDGVTATPEPSSLLLLGAGLLGIALLGRNR